MPWDREFSEDYKKLMACTFGLAPVKDHGEPLFIDQLCGPKKEKKYETHWMELPLRSTMSKHKVHCLVEKWLNDMHWRN